MKLLHKNIYKGIAYTLFLAVSFACTDGFDNKKPYQPDGDDLDGDNFRVGAVYAQLQQNVISTNDNQYQRSQNLVGDIFSGHMSVVNNWNSNKNHATYFFYDKWQDECFKSVYTGAFGAWLEIKKILGSDENSHAFQFAQILKVASLHRFTDMWGPIPYSKVGGGGLTSPYDSQEEVYNLFFQELDRAIEVLTLFTTTNPGAAPMADYDLVYKGDYVKWIKFANSLKLRLAMRIAYVNPTLAKQKAEESIKHSVGVILSNSDNASIQTANGIKVVNPIYTIAFGYNEVRMGASMQSFMGGYDDPRISRYFTQGTLNNQTGYFGVRNGIQVNNASDYKFFSAPNIESDTPIFWLTASEVAFLKAEGALRGWDMNGVTAQEAYEEGIRLSFAQYAVPGSDDYMQDDTKKPMNYVNPLYSVQNISPATSITIKWDDTANLETKLERIITQKWIALYPNGQEAWSEFRRTGYPKIFPIVYNASGNIVNSKVQVRRLPFPPCEYINNTENVQNAVDKWLGGTDNGAVKLWWDAK
ncbi:RagB/SusD family nutrient uptake outer membrane protein [Bacteroides sp.]|uniref:RagB/SusD family nutrient uptake outer membrane protein n=2 Tax=Bacteroides sp. TaxID=29523 RepID=UPI002FC95EDF